MLMRMGLDRDRFWWLSMGILGMEDVLVILLSHIGWGFGSTYVWGGVISSDISDLTMGLALRSVFGRMFGIGRVLSKRYFMVCLVLPGSGKLSLRIIWSVPMIPFSGTLFSPV
jgi:hypothetical protein